MSHARVFGWIGLVCLLILATTVMTVSAQQVQLQPSSTKVTVGSNFTVDVVVSGCGKIISFVANVTSTSNVEYQGVVKYPDSWTLLTANPIRVFTLDNTSAVDTTNGASVVTLGFKAVSDGLAQINLSDIAVKDINDTTIQLNDVSITVNVTNITNVTITKINVTVEPSKVVVWGRPNNVYVTVTTPEGYPVEGANVTLMGVNTGSIYGTESTNESGIAVFTIVPSSEDTGGIKVIVTYWNGTALLVNTSSITVKPPTNLTYVYGYARIANTDVPVPLANANITIYINFDSKIKPSVPYCYRNTTENGEFVFPVEVPKEKANLYIWIETKDRVLGYVRARFSTENNPAYVPIEAGTTSVQANVPVNAIVKVKYPDNLVVQVFNESANRWSNDKTLDTSPKKADGNSMFKVKVQLKLGNESYNLTNLTNALAKLGITRTLPDYVHVCVNDTNIAVISKNISTNGQKCDNITFINKSNSTAIFYVRSNAPTDPSKLKPENTGVVNITGWYNYTVIPNTKPVNVPNNLTDYDYAEFEGTGFIAGEVVDGQTEHSISGATVYVKYWRGSAWVNATDFEGNQIITTTDEHGHYKVEVISGRFYKVYAEKEGYTGCAPSDMVYVPLGTTVTADVTLISAVPTTVKYMNPETHKIDINGLMTAIFDWQHGNITTTDLMNVIWYWQTGTPVE